MGPLFVAAPWQDLFMPHPQMFDDEDPLLARVRTFALALPEAAEKVSHGRPAFFTRKVFAYYGGSRKVDDRWIQHPQSIVLLGDLDQQAAMRAMPDSYVPAYLGPYGWTGLDLGPETDWEDVEDLIRESHRSTATPALRRRLAL